ncbi:hypothetical protein [Flammeovirga pacifica]|uniref:Uncharacterized protein n=1 Tax=Flammeovirga pacifica TaxID=915059 RepID=A0A1S1YWB8_FLAPC|nr:hypothetical protein [Flammeovirga pacifica]OHX65322.1 hypothetical protein NH26_02635 [Flammeovirga pacifica]
MKKYRLKLNEINFRFLQSILFKLAEAYKDKMPEDISHQLLLELYDAKFNISLFDTNKEKVMQLNRSQVMAFHIFLSEIPLKGEIDLIRNQLFNDFDVFLT